MKIKYIIIPHLLILIIFLGIAVIYGNPAEKLCKWDCLDWYSELAETGYYHVTSLSPHKIGAANWAFFPGFPGVAYVVMHLFHVSFQVAGLIINSIAIPLIVYYGFQCQELNNQLPRASNIKKYSIIFLSIPSMFWMRIQYSESIFGLFLILFYYNIIKNRLVFCFFLSGALCLTRPTGIFCVIVILIYKYISSINVNKEKLSSFLNFNINYAILFISPFFYISLYMIFLHFWAGDSLAFSHVQYAWGRVSKFPGYWIWDSIKKLHHINLVISSFIDIYVIYKGYQKKMFIESTVLLVKFFVAITSSLLSIHRIIMANPFFIMILESYFITWNKKSMIFFVVLFTTISIMMEIAWINGTRLLF